MALVDFTQRTITLNVLYFGPRGAGCGTNVRHLHRVQPAREKVELRRLGSVDKKERIWHFTYRPEDPPRTGGFELRIRVASIPAGPGPSHGPSGPDSALDRDAFFEGVDGVVFVSDARANRTEDNLAALLDLERCLAHQGLDLGAVPMIFQVNQTDAPNARPQPRVLEDINPMGAAAFEAMARQGKGVLEAHEAIRNAVLARLRDNLARDEATVSLTSMSRSARQKAEETVLEHVAGLPQATRPMPRNLAVAASTEVLVRPPELREAEPVQVVRSEVRAGRVRVETLIRRADGGTRKLAFLIESGGEAATPIPDVATEPIHAGHHAMPHSSGGEFDMPGMIYGVVGVVGGLVSGFMFGYIVFG